MARLTPLHLIPALIAAASHAGEVTIEQRPFSIEKSFTAAALPGGDCVLVQNRSQSLDGLQDRPRSPRTAPRSPRATCSSASIPRTSTGKSRTPAARSNPARSRWPRPNSTPRSSRKPPLTNWRPLRRAAEIAKEENTYFTKTRRKASEETAAQALKRSEQILSNQREELKQLSKMYEADDITEDTEEIILVRQQDAVAAAEFALRMEILDHKRTLEVTLPREAKTLADSERDTAISLKKAEAEIPRSIELGKTRPRSPEDRQPAREKDLAELEADRTLFEFKAPADGIFYHGPIENGRWTTGDTRQDPRPPRPPARQRRLRHFRPRRPPSSRLVAFLDEATARSLKPELAGIATLAGREELEIPVKLLALAAAPDPDGTYRADLSVTWPKELVPAAGATAQIRLISYQKPSAIAVPTKALEFGADGWTVEVKLADGKTERRPVKRGRVSNDETEILSRASKSARSSSFRRNRRDPRPEDARNESHDAVSSSGSVLCLVSCCPASSPARRSRPASPSTPPSAAGWIS